jgi:TolB-like protein
MVRKTADQETGRLSPRQNEILRLVAKGFTNKEIGELLRISNNTVKIHVAAILDILNVTNRTEATFVYNQEIVDAENRAPGSLPSGNTGLVRRPSIVVSPFSAYVHDRVYDSLPRGITEDLIMRLSAWSLFSIVSADAVTQLADGADRYDHSKSPEIKYVITGSIRTTADHIRVNYKASEYATQKTILASVYEANSKDLFTIQDEISLKISAMIVPELLNAEGKHIPDVPSKGMEPWDMTMRGFHLLNHRTAAATKESLRFFRSVYEMNPDYHLACYGLVLCHYRMLTEQWTDDVSATSRELCAMAQRCLHLDNRNAYSHFAFGVVNIVTGSPQKALEYLKRAIEFNPSFVTAHLLLGQVYAIMDQHDAAIACMERALFLDSSILSFGINLGAIGMLHFAAGRYAEAIESSERCLQMVPNSLLSLVVATSAYGLTRQMEHAKTKASLLLNSFPSFSIDNLTSIMKSVHQAHRDRVLQGLAIAGVIDSAAL